ncbi:MAG: hypothetical protein RJQ04_20230 [Longimicrobiales bacterium]
MADIDSHIPSHLENRRLHRYRGDGQDLRMADFESGDQVRVRRLYEGVDRVYQAWLVSPSDPPWNAVLEAALALTAPDFHAQAATLGDRSRAAGPENSRLQRVVHDIRGGGLTPAMLNAALIDDGAPDVKLLQTIVYLCRDHAKIMRNAVVDIDPTQRARDEEERPHGVAALLGAWDGRLHRVGGGEAVVRTDASWEGHLSSCCLEVSAVDRVLYNHVNNATRFAADGTVCVHASAATEAVARITVSNSVDAQQAEWLRTRLAEDPGAPYRPGVTRGGQGLGLTNAAAFVAAAFGLDHPGEAVDGGYLGARLDDHRYVAWFHWPIFG